MIHHVPSVYSSEASMYTCLRVCARARARIFSVRAIQVRTAENLSKPSPLNPATKRIHAVKYAFDWSLRVRIENAQLLSSPSNVPESLRATFFLTAKK